MGDLAGVLGVLVPIVAIVMGIGLALARSYFALQRRRLQHQERLAMIERGITPPPEPPADDRRAGVLMTASPQHALRRGTVLSFLGIGFAVAAIVVAYTGDDKDLVWIAGSAGAIIGFLGLGNLVYYFLIRDRKAETPGYDARA